MKIHFVLLLLCLASSMFAQAKETIRVGFIEYPPLVISSGDGVAQGPLIDYLEQNLAPAFDVVWVKIPFGRVRWGFANNYIDAFPFYVHTPEREAWANFPDKPFLSFQSIICSRLDHERPAAQLRALPEDMFDAKLVFPLNSEYVFPFLHSPRLELIKLEYTHSKKRALALLDLGRVDYVMFPSSDGVQPAVRDKLSCSDVGERQTVFFTSRKGYPHMDKLEKTLESFVPFDY